MMVQKNSFTENDIQGTLILFCSTRSIEDAELLGRFFRLVFSDGLQR